MTGLPHNFRGFYSIWEIVDRMIKLAHFFRVKTIYSAYSYGKLYVDKIIRLHGIPMSIISNCRLQFTSYFWKAFQKALGTRFDLSTAFLPQRDGQFESTIQTLEDMLRSCVLHFGGNWDSYLALVEFS